MTTKFTITRIVNTMMPITKLPLITKLPNASMTWPAAAVPSWPRDRIRRVEARLSASRSMVEISRMVGNEENSSGVWMNSAVIRISTDRMIEIARNMSSTTAGSGRISTTRMVITPIASAMSPRLNRSLERADAGDREAAGSLSCRDVGHRGGAAQPCCSDGKIDTTRARRIGAAGKTGSRRSEAVRRGTKSRLPSR